MLEGRLHLEADGEKLEVGPHEALVIHSSSGHQLWNAGADDITYLAVAAPPAAADSSTA